MLEVEGVSGEGRLAQCPGHEGKGVRMRRWGGKEGRTSRCGRRIPAKVVGFRTEKGFGGRERERVGGWGITK